MKAQTLAVLYETGVPRRSAALPARGSFYPPTLIVGVEPASRLAREEIFGPVLVTMTFRTPDEAVALAEQIAKNAPLAVRLSKQVMKQAAELSEDEAWSVNDAVFGEIGRSADAMEGAIAFAEKREPNWTGK